MIRTLWDSSCGEINKFPHKMQGALSAGLDTGSVELCGRGCGNPSDEILKCDRTYIYIRDINRTSVVNVYDENGYKVKELSIDDLDL